MSNQTDEFAFINGKIDAVEDGGRAVGGGVDFGDSIDGEEWHVFLVGDRGDWGTGRLGNLMVGDGNTWVRGR